MKAEHLPRDIARCKPTGQCRQRCDCARATDWPRGVELLVIDASVTLRPRQAACWLFIDARGLAMREAA